jgi:hypothetical protein
MNVVALQRTGGFRYITQLLPKHTFNPISTSDGPMKGPGERLKYDLFRVWECPVCHHRERTLGDRTSCLCRCQRKQKPTERVWMKLLEDGVRRLSGPSAL